MLLFKEGEAFIDKTKAIFLLGSYLAERGTTDVHGQELCESLFFLICVEAPTQYISYTGGVRREGS